MKIETKSLRVQITEELVRQWSRSARGGFFSDREVRGFDVRVTPKGTVLVCADLPSPRPTASL